MLLNKVVSEVVTENVTPRNFAVLGTFEGECADANITNENGLDITRPVWENVFNSELYQNALDHGWYIGFLGHPEDPNCMDFEHACIVMTECHIADDGKVYGKFNLIDTPVGRIVKSFIDAGVTFGISVRGAGDIINNSVDPETFVFRGFDLVTFPAYPKSIPEFTEIAAASDPVAQQKYRSVCAAVRSNIQGLNTVDSIEMLQQCFAKQSPEYNLLSERKAQLSSVEMSSDISTEKLNGVMQLYLSQLSKTRALQNQLKASTDAVKTLEHRYSRKFASLRRISASQLDSVQSKLEAVQNLHRASVAACQRLKQEVEALTTNNLKYKQKVDASEKIISNNAVTISRLESKLRETVTSASDIETRSSNLDARNKVLSAEITAAYKLVQEYQDAYANLYATALGVRPGNISISSTTSVSELQKLLGAVSSKPVSTEDTPDIDIISMEDDLVTL